MTPREKGNEQLRCLTASFADSCDGLIYHYTSPEGLKGIIDSGELWLTNTAFVNDTTEGKALGNENDLFEESDFENKEIWDEEQIFFNRGCDNTRYIISFSKEPDMLSQLRAYGNFCIGFEASQLIGKGFYFYDCIYSRQEIKAWLLQKDKMQEWKGEHLNEQRRRLAAFSLIYAAQMKYKSEHYISEREVRLMAVSNHSWGYLNNPGIYKKEPPIHFRDHPEYKLPVPYVKFFVSKDDKGQPKDYDDTDMTEQEIKAEKRKVEAEQERDLLPIEEVRIGPTANQKDAEIACQILLQERGYKDVKIIPSKIPYRGF